jgi:hypothetical protein
MSNPFESLEQELRSYKEGRTERALNRLLFDASAMGAEFTPVDTSNLINSRFVSVTDFAQYIEGKVGYTARYAKWVANMPGTLKGKPRAHFGRTSNRSEFGPKQSYEFGGGTGRGRYWDPNAEPDFLNKGMRRAIEESWPAIVKEDLEV